MRIATQDRGELGFAGLLLTLGAFVLVDTSTIEIPKAASNVGPRFFPYAVGLLLTVAAAAVVVDILRGNSAEPEESELIDPSQPLNWRRVALVIGSVVAFGALLDPAGYVVAGAVAFFGVTFALGARQYARNTVIAVLLSLLVYVAFTRGLGIFLPAGVLEGIL